MTKLIVAFACLFIVVALPGATTPAPHVPGAAPVTFRSNPIGVANDPAGDPCGTNVATALEDGTLRNVRIAPGETWSYNMSWGGHDRLYYNCAGVYGGNLCNLAARYAQTARALGLTPIFQDHGVGDLGGGPENSVAIWNLNDGPGNHGVALDLLLTNPTSRLVWLRAVDGDGSVVIEGGME